MCGGVCVSVHVWVHVSQCVWVHVGVYVGTCVLGCVWEYVRVWRLVKGIGWSLLSTSITFPPHFWDSVCLCWFVGLVGSRLQDPSMSASPALEWQECAPRFAFAHCRCWRANSGPHVYRAKHLADWPITSACQLIHTGIIKRMLYV